MEKYNLDINIVKSFYENQDFGVCIFNSRDEIIFCNKKLCQIIGLSEKEVSKMKFHKIFKDKADLEKILEALENEGTVYDCRFGLDEGKKSSFNISFTTYDSKYSMACFMDNSENSRLKSELLIAEKRITIAQKAADIGSWEYDYETGLFTGSEKSNIIFGEPNLFPGISIDTVFEFVQDKEKARKDFEDFINGLKPYDSVFKIISKDSKEEKVIYSTGSIFKDNSGKPIKAVGYIKDITQWVKMEEKATYDKNMIDRYLNFVGTIIVMLDINGMVTFLNNKGSELLGYKPEDLIGKSWIDTVIREEDRDEINDVRHKTYNKEIDKRSFYENVVLNSSGEELFIRWNNTVILDEHGDITGTISSGEDITDIKHNEKRFLENEQSLKKAEIKAKMGHWFRKPDEDYLIWSDGLYHMFGYEPNEFPPAVQNTLNSIHEDDRERYADLIKGAVEKGENYSADLRGRKKDGEIIFIRVEAEVSAGENGRAESIYGIVTDITESYNRIKELEDAKTRLDLSEVMSKTGHWQRNLDSNTYIFSEELYRIFGIDEGVRLITHELLHEKFHPEDRQRVSVFTEEKLKKGEDYSFDARILKSNGETVYVEAYVQIVNDSSGRPIIANGVMRDVTERKIHEKKLEQREFQLKRAEEIAGAGNWIMDIDTGNYVCSDNFYKICGFDPDNVDATFETIMSATHPDDIERINKIIEESMKSGSDYEFENRLVLQDGSIRHVRSKGTYIKDKDGKPIKSVGTLLNITEYKKTESGLIESRQKLEKAEEIAHMGHWERDHKESTSYWSDGIYRIIGAKPQSFEASESKYEKIIHPDDFDEFRKNAMLAREGKIPYIIETRFIDSKGNVKYIKIRGNTIKENDEIVRSFGTIEDITEEKLHEKELIEKNKMLDEAESVAHVGHFINNYVDGTRYWSDEMYRILGYEPQTELDKGSLYKKLMEPEEFQKTVEEMNKAIRSRKDTHEANFSIKDAKGNKKYLRHLYRFKYKDGEHTASFGVVQDMSELKAHYEDMEYMNYHDSLTDLYNRRYFDEVFEEIDVKDNYPISVIVADINGLKMVNDTLGHSSGDRLIMKTARILKSVCEEEDILARIGGDDFILLMPGTIKSQAEIVMNELHDLITQAEAEMPISVSMGLAVKLNSQTTKEEFIKEAEDNMYTSKLYEKTSKRGDLLRLIMDTLYERSSREEKHSERVSKYCGEMAKALKMPKHKINELTSLGLLHDIGKIAVKDSVLNKPGKLDEEEWQEIKKHSETGYRILSQSPGMLQASKYVLAHHERWDGKGYPQGLKSYEIPTQARIISICDAFDAMRSKRPYRDPVPLEEAVSEIKKGAGNQFDPELAKVFVVQVLGEKW